VGFFAAIALRHENSRVVNVCRHGLTVAAAEFISPARERWVEWRRIMECRRHGFYAFKSGAEKREKIN